MWISRKTLLTPLKIGAISILLMPLSGCIEDDPLLEEAEVQMTHPGQSEFKNLDEMLGWRSASWIPEGATSLAGRILSEDDTTRIWLICVNSESREAVLTRQTGPGEFHSVNDISSEFRAGLDAACQTDTTQ